MRSVLNDGLWEVKRGDWLWVRKALGIIHRVVLLLTKILFIWLVIRVQKWYVSIEIDLLFNWIVSWFPLSCLFYNNVQLCLCLCVLLKCVKRLKRHLSINRFSSWRKTWWMLCFKLRFCWYVLRVLSVYLFLLQIGFHHFVSICREIWNLNSFSSPMKGGWHVTHFIRRSFRPNDWLLKLILDTVLNEVDSQEVLSGCWVELSKNFLRGVEFVLNES